MKFDCLQQNNNFSKFVAFRQNNDFRKFVYSRIMILEKWFFSAEWFWKFDCFLQNNGFLKFGSFWQNNDFMKFSSFQYLTIANCIFWEQANICVIDNLVVTEIIYWCYIWLSMDIICLIVPWSSETVTGVGKGLLYFQETKHLFSSLLFNK